MAILEAHDDIYWAESFEGQAPIDNIRMAAGGKNVGCLVQVLGVEKHQQFPRGSDRSDTIIQVQMAYPSIRVRKVGGRTARDLFWAGVYDGLRGQTLNLEWLFPLQYREWVTLHHDQSGIVLSMIFATSFSMALWSE